jgi:hypothetical protein
VFQPPSTGITFALTDKAPGDKIPLLTVRLRLQRSAGRRRLQVELPDLPEPTGPAPTSCAAHRKKEGGCKLKGKKIALVYHDSPYGKEPIPLLQERAKLHGFELQLIPVTAPGVEQKAAWLQDRQSRPDYVLPLGLGRHELDGAQGSAGDRLPAREDVRRAGGRAPSRNARTSATAPRATTRWRCSTRRAKPEGRSRTS